MRFTIGSEVYTVQTLDRLTLGEILRLEAETTSLGRPMKWSQIRAMANALDGLEAEEFEDHDDAPWVIALVIWASRLRKGEVLSFAEAIDFPLGELSFLPEPSDHKAPANPTRPPKGSAGGGKRAAAAKAAKRTSATQSSPA